MQTAELLNDISFEDINIDLNCPFHYCDNENFKENILWKAENI